MNLELLRQLGQRRSSVGIVLLMALVVISVGLGSRTDRALSQTCDGPGYDTSHILVKVKPDASEESVQRIRGLNGEGKESPLAPTTISNWWVVGVPEGLTVTEAVELYKADPDVEYAEPDYIIRIPEDPCLQPKADIGLPKVTDSPDPVRRGENLTYTMALTNSGPSAAIDTILWTRVPEGSRYVSSHLVVGSSERTCPPDEAGKVECQIGELAAGKEATLTMVVHPTKVGRLYNTVDAYAANDIGGYSTEPTYVTEVLPPERCTVVGTEGADELVGRPGPDVICGFGGDDHIYGEGGKDLINGGRDSDFIVGGSGGDEIFGGRGPDRLNSRDGVRGNDVVRGGLGRDTISSDTGDRARD